VTVLPRSPAARGAGAGAGPSAGASAGRLHKAASALSPALLMLSPGGEGDSEEEDGRGGGAADGADGGDGGAAGADQAARVHKCAEILSALRAAGLQAKRVRSLSRRTWLIKIRCAEWRLEVEAEKLRLRMRRRDGVSGSARGARRERNTRQGEARSSPRNCRRRSPSPPSPRPSLPPFLFAPSLARCPLLGLVQVPPQHAGRLRASDPGGGRGGGRG
jgi:hypothetical protein